MPKLKPKRLNVLAVLQNMWGRYPWEDLKAPLYFEINPYNLSGRRLYRACAGHKLLVTNVASSVGLHANDHQKPDIPALRAKLIQPNCDVFLVCGKVARGAFLPIYQELELTIPYVLMPHPASRVLTNHLLDGVNGYLNEGSLDPKRLMSVEFEQLRGSYTVTWKK